MDNDGDGEGDGEGVVGIPPNSLSTLIVTKSSEFLFFSASRSFLAFVHSVSFSSNNDLRACKLGFCSGSFSASFLFLSSSSMDSNFFLNAWISLS